MTPSVTGYVPGDSAARSVGADEVAEAVLKAGARVGQPVHLVRNGTRGMLWLERKTFCGSKRRLTAIRRSKFVP